MATTIKIKNSATPSSTPSSLEQGEMALNVTDGRLFYGSGSGNTVKEFTGGGGSPIDTGSFATTGSNTFIGDQIITGSVEITGAITASIVSASYIDLDVLANGDIPSHKAGRIFFGAEDGALEVYNEEADITLQVGQEFWVRVYNLSGAPILNGTPVYASGSQGDRIGVYPALAEDHTTGVHYDNHILGVTTHDIGISEEGYITAQGIVRGVDTSTFTAGDILYLQTGSAGLRNTPPPFPYDIVQVGYVARSASPNGFVFVEPKEPVHFNNISGLSGSASEPGDLWIYQSNNAWSPSKTLSGSYTISNGGLTADSFTGSLQGTATTASYIAAANIDGTIDISDQTNLAGGTNLTLSGDTMNLDNDITLTSINVTHITASGNISGSQTGSFAYLQLPGFEFDSSAPTSELEVDHRLFDTGSSTLGSNGGSIGDIVKFGGTSTTAGHIYYLKQDGTWGNADASDTSASTGSLAVALGANSTTNGMLLRGMTKLSTDPSAGTGQPVFLSTTANQAQSAAPNASGEVVRILGHQFGTDLIYFNPSPDYIVLS